MRRTLMNDSPDVDAESVVAIDMIQQATAATSRPGAHRMRLVVRESALCARIGGRPTRDLPVGEAGELAVRGPQVFHGYWTADAPEQLATEGS